MHDIHCAFFHLFFYYLKCCWVLACPNDFLMDNKVKAARGEVWEQMYLDDTHLISHCIMALQQPVIVQTAGNGWFERLIGLIKNQMVASSSKQMFLKKKKFIFYNGPWIQWPQVSICSEASTHQLSKPALSNFWKSSVDVFVWGQSYLVCKSSCLNIFSVSFFTLVCWSNQGQTCVMPTKRITGPKPALPVGG